jgi:epoxyqueuosine reductase
MKLTLTELKRLGQEAGFDEIGSTTTDPFPELIPRLRSYEQRGRTGFEYEDIELRVNPKQWFPKAKSLIAVAMAYMTPEGRNMAHEHPRSRTHGILSVYSYGQDYHQVMEARLRLLVHLIEQKLGAKVSAKIAVDTSPLVDRRIAERAGIGWMAKNCMLYSSGHGSFVFLGTLLVDVEIEGTAREQSSHCGECVNCLTACPTNALIAPGVIDAKRCLSYVTQMKGIIPVEFRKPLGRRIWGCDTCQWSCPENKQIKDSQNLEYLPQGELEYPDLLDILKLTNRTFQRKYGHTAAVWRGLRTWQRNALIALGNARNTASVSEITPFLRHARPELRASATWALSQIGGAEAKSAVREAYAEEVLCEVKAEMEWALQDEE